MVIGVLGGGQLGQMLALAGIPLGIEFRFLDPSADSVAGRVGELIVGAYDDPVCLARLAHGAHAVTFEFENVPAGAIEWLARRVPTFPPQAALAAAQDRVAEKALFAELGIAIPRLAGVSTPDELRAGVERVGVPCVVKTRRMGYDGKGQAVVRDISEVEEVWTRLGGGGSGGGDGGGGLIVEEFVAFGREVSIIGVRGRDGACAFYPLTQNVHRGGILRQSIAPAPDSAGLQATAEAYCRAVMERLGYVGVLAIEFFEKGGVLWANEMAPRVHNSGHWTIEGSICSQFENHVRAVAGLPLGETQMAGGPGVGGGSVAGMVNLIGTPLDLIGVLGEAGSHLHWYGKEPRAGRKVG
ncbi:MAG: 5-(carboxyamino)imidazole ribonucleotide synthase, partial [Planctomycetota bacterium]